MTDFTSSRIVQIQTFKTFALLGKDRVKRVKNTSLNIYTNEFKYFAEFKRLTYSCQNINPAPSSGKINYLGLLIIVESCVGILTILEFPDERLRKKATDVAVVDAGIKKLVSDMLETMYEAKGVGLAATQVDVHKKVIVIDISEEKNAPLCFINPVLVKLLGVAERDEGCLSVPGFFEPVERAEKIVVQALDAEGKAFEMEAEGLLGICIQHEMDHLQGKLFVDYLSSLKRVRIKKKLEKIHKAERK